MVLPIKGAHAHKKRPLMQYELVTSNLTKSGLGRRASVLLGPPRNGQMTRKILSLLAILYGLIYFFYESWYHLNFGQSVLNLSIDYLAIILLLVAGTVNLKASNGEGLLCGAWGFAACLMMRAYAWRHDTASLGIEESRVMSLLIFAIAISTFAFGASLILSFSRGRK